jgi:hypothetical protein
MVPLPFVHFSTAQHRTASFPEARTGFLPVKYFLDAPSSTTADDGVSQQHFPVFSILYALFRVYGDVDKNHNYL